jgi:acetyl-CoA synthetase
MGKPTPGPGVVLIDEDGNPVKQGEIGEIALRPDSPAIFDGYWKSPELDKEAFSSGWYRTGDLVRMDEEGYLFFEGRADDVIRLRTPWSAIRRWSRQRRSPHRTANAARSSRHS